MKVTAYVHAYVGHGREAGAETTLANLLESMVREGWKAEVILTDPNVDHYLNHGVSVRSDYGHGHVFLEAAAKTDLIISHLECSERAALVARKFNKPIVQVIHNTFWQTEGYLAEGCSLAVYNSNWVAEYHSNSEKGALARLATRQTNSVAINFRARRMHEWSSVVVHPQIDPKKYHATGGSHKFITMVNLHENKGPHIFWEMANRFPDLDFLAVLGGYGKQEIPSYVPKNVRIDDNHEDMAGTYAASKMILMPSDYESFGRVAVEAAAQGVPTIAHNTPGLMEALAPEGYAYGLLVDKEVGMLGWEQAIRRMSNPEFRHPYEVKAKLLSHYWDNRRDIETKTFLEKATEIAERGKRCQL